MSWLTCLAPEGKGQVYPACSLAVVSQLSANSSRLCNRNSCSGRWASQKPVTSFISIARSEESWRGGPPLFFVSSLAGLSQLNTRGCCGFILLFPQQPEWLLILKRGLWGFWPTGFPTLPYHLLSQQGFGRTKNSRQVFSFPTLQAALLQCPFCTTKVYF